MPDQEGELNALTRRELRSPRAAAIAGIVYSLLTFTAMILTQNTASVQPQEVTRENIFRWASTLSLVLTLVPFAGIAFLWFTGVIRDRLRDREDRFFATIFFGSGIIYVLLLFLWGAILGTILRLTAMEQFGDDVLFSSGVVTYALILMNEINGNFALRMAGVYMSAVGTIWNRTKLMPRWLILLTYLLALGFLVAADRFREARYIFPAWVLIISIYILILNYRSADTQKKGQEVEKTG